MPRDVSGNYTLPAGNPVVDGTIIATTWANPTMADIATQLNNVLTRDGLLGPTAPVKFTDGTAALPGITFASSASTGFYKTATYLGASYNGTEALRVKAAAVETSNALLVAQGIDATAAQVEIGGGRTADGDAYIDFVAASGNPDYNFRILRNSGTNGAASVYNAGSGALSVGSIGTGSLDFVTSSVQRARIAADRNQLGIGTLNSFEGSTAIAGSHAYAATGLSAAAYRAESQQNGVISEFGVDPVGQIGYVGTLSNHNLNLLTNLTKRFAVGSGGMTGYYNGSSAALGLATGAGTNSGHIEFIRPDTGVRLGYVGASPPTTNTQDAGEINYGGRAHIFLNQSGTVAPTELRVLANIGPTTSAYVVGGLYGQAFRDIYPAGAYIAGIEFQRASSSGGLSSAGSIILRSSNLGDSAASSMPVVALFRGDLALFGNTFSAVNPPNGVSMVNLDAATQVGIGHLSGTISGAGYAVFNLNSVVIGSITQNGTTAVAYNTTSDYRLKHDVVELEDSGYLIDGLRPVRWTWPDGLPGVGFIAHEVQELGLTSATGTKDAVDEAGKDAYQQMAYGSGEFIALVVAELQSLRARVKALESRVH